jgi:hypothetical protein
MTGVPLDVVERAAPLLLEDGCLRESDGGYIIPNFMAAQEARTSDAQRKREQRERDRADAMASGIPPGTSATVIESLSASARDVTIRDHDRDASHAMSSQNVTESHTASQRVTRCHSTSRLEEKRREENREALPPPSSAALEGFVLEPEKPTLRSKKSKPEKPTDPRHAPLTEALCEHGGWPHHGGRTATVLLAHADRTPGQGGASAIGEVQRRAALARASDGFPRVRELHELAEHWGHFAEAPRGQGPPRADPNAGIVRGTKSECAGCGSEGETANVGEPETRLGYACGCLSEWIATGLKFTEAAPWAERKRHGAA